MNNINKQDITAYVLSLHLSDIDTKGCIDTFYAIHTLNNKEFQDYIKNENEAKLWYAEMYGYIYQYKKETEAIKLKNSLPEFDFDIRKYTDNKKCIEYFSNGYKFIWLSLSEAEKKLTVEKFNGQDPNDSVIKDSKTDKAKTSIQLKIDDILDNRKNNENSLKQFEDNIPTYDNTETIIDYAKQQNKDAVVTNEFDIDSLFVELK